MNKLHIEVQPAQAALARFGAALQSVMEGAHASRLLRNRV